jgi:pyruvate,orthophosphate dikinase
MKMQKYFSINGVKYKEGDYVSLDGSTGKVYGQKLLRLLNLKLAGYFGTFMSWADNIRKLKVRTNADIPRDAKQAVKFGAEGM